MSDITPHVPAQISVPNDVLNSVEAELRQEASQPTPDFAPPEPTPPPVTPPQPQEPQPDPQELERGYMRDRDYRQKTMSLAEERRQLEQQRQTELLQRQQEAQFIREAQQAYNDAQWLEQRLQALRQQHNLPQPDQVLNASQAQQLISQREAALEAKLEQKLQERMARYEIDRSSIEFSSKIQQQQQQLLKEHPLLELIPGVEKLITNDAFAHKPGTWDEAQAFMKQAAADRAAKIQKKIADHEQAAIMRHTKQAQPAMEPKGGTAPAVPSVRNPKFGSQALQDRIMDDLLQEQNAKR